MGSQSTSIQPLPTPNNAVKMVLSSFTHATKRIMMGVVDGGHTKVNLYQFYGVSLLQINRPDLMWNLCIIKKKKNKKIQMQVWKRSGIPAFHFRSWQGFYISHGCLFNEKETIFNHLVSYHTWWRCPGLTQRVHSDFAQWYHKYTLNLYNL